MTTDTWFVVLNWNGRDDTLELLEGLSRERVTVVVVDNGSTDGSVEAVRARFPDVRTLQTGDNLGYAGGNNAGIAYALEEGADVIGVLNNDTLVEAGFVDPLLIALTTTAAVAVSPDIRYVDDPDVSWFRGSRIDQRTGWPQHLTPGEQPPPDGPPIASPVLTGCCIVASAETWRTVGRFDDGLFLMFEDSDWSCRAVERGVELLVVPQSHIQHKVSRSFTGTAASLGNYYFARNGMVFAWRHLGWSAAVRFLLRQVLRPSLRQLIDPRQRAGAMMSLLGVLAAFLGKRGHAGSIASTFATRAAAAQATASGRHE